MRNKNTIPIFVLVMYMVLQVAIPHTASAASVSADPLVGPDTLISSSTEVDRIHSVDDMPQITVEIHRHEPQKIDDTSAKAAACNLNAFITSGSSLTNQIKTQGFSCITELFSASSSVKDGTFTQNNVITVANEARSQSQSYNGSDPDGYVKSLYYWIRAFYFVKGPDSINATNQAAVRSAIEALFNNSKVWTKNGDTGDLVNHAAVDLNNARIGQHFVPQLISMIDRFDESYQATTNWGNALATMSWNALSYCSKDAACRAAQHKSSLVLKVSNFMHDNIAWLNKSLNDYHLHNFGYQLGNFYASKNDAHFSAMKSTLDAELNRVFNNFGYMKGDDGRRGYMLALNAINFHGVCAEFNLCNIKDQIINDVLSDRITCPSGSLFMWAQDMNQAQLNWACSSLQSHESYFHSKMKTNGTPVTPDDNDKLRMIVFDDSNEWKTYGGALFNASTNNGGLYLEGDPSKAGDQATFFAYEEVNARPIFDIWNLRHEYIHYLDGRFNTHGDFGAFNGTGRTVWYGEGVAEYISRKNCNDDAASKAAASTYDISTIFTNEYGVSQERIYPWGYLAVRYMYEQQNSKFFQMIDKFRQGDYASYRSSMVDTWVGSKTYDSGFKSWLSGVTSSGCTIDNTRPQSEVDPINVDDIQGSDQPGVNACSSSAGNPDNLKAGIAQCLVNQSNGARESLAISVPAGLVNVTMEVTLRHGSGTANLLHKTGSWPKADDYDYRTTGGVASSQLFELSILNNELKKINIIDNNIEYLSYSESAQRLVFESIQTPYNIHYSKYADDNLELVDQGGLTAASNRQQLEALQSPDQRYTALISSRSGKFEVWLVDDLNGQSKKLTDIKAISINGLDWSPHSDRLAFVATIDGETALYWMFLENKQLHRVAYEGKNYSLVGWENKDSSLLFSSNPDEEWKLWRLNTNNNDIELVSNEPIVQARLSPDRKMIYFIKYKHPGIWSARLANIASALIPGTESINVYQSWTVTEKGIFYAVYGNNIGNYDELYFQSFNENKPTLAMKIPHLYLNRIYWANDRLFYSVYDQRRSDIAMIEGL